MNVRTMEETVRSFMVNLRARWQDKTVISAMSGGPDSAALSHVLAKLSAELGFTVVLAHFNHQLRGRESNREALLVQRLAKRWGVACEIGSGNVAQFKKETGWSTQLAARELRYRFLREAAARHRASHIALAHHADDQAETILMRLIRGVGTDGLEGIPQIRDWDGITIMRPLLSVRKASLLRYCEELRIPFARDSSNDSRDYFRNRIRLDLMPLLERYNPRLTEALCRLADIAAQDQAFLKAETERSFFRLVEQTEDVCRFDRKAFLELPLALQRRVVKLILSYLSPQSRECDFRTIGLVLGAIADAQVPHKQLDLPGQTVFRREYDHIAIGKTGPLSGDRAGYRYEVQRLPASLTIAEAGYILEISEPEPFLAQRKLEEAMTGRLAREEAVFDREALRFPLCIRPRLPGDRIRLQGAGGTRKIKDVLIDAKVPRSLRDRLPLVVDRDGQVLWIPTVRRSGIGLVDRGSRRIVHMELKKFIQ